MVSQDLGSTILVTYIERPSVVSLSITILTQFQIFLTGVELGPKGPIWEEISSGMVRLDYRRYEDLTLFPPVGEIVHFN